MTTYKFLASDSASAMEEVVKKLGPDALIVSTSKRGNKVEIEATNSLARQHNQKDIKDNSNLEILLESDEVGPCLIEDKVNNFLFLLNHLEYDSNTLNEEYVRDLAKEKNLQVPQNYFPNDDPQLNPINRWRSHAHLLYGNWINEIYQTTPFDIQKIGLKQA